MRRLAKRRTKRETVTPAYTLAFFQEMSSKPPPRGNGLFVESTLSGVSLKGKLLGFGAKPRRSFFPGDWALVLFRG